MSGDHPFNPHVYLRSTLSDEDMFSIAAGLSPVVAGSRRSKKSARRKMNQAKTAEAAAYGLLGSGNMGVLGALPSTHLPSSHNAVAGYGAPTPMYTPAHHGSHGHGSHGQPPRHLPPGYHPSMAPPPPAPMYGHYSNHGQPHAGMHGGMGGSGGGGMGSGRGDSFGFHHVSPPMHPQPPQNQHVRPYNYGYHPNRSQNY